MLRDVRRLPSSSVLVATMLALASGAGAQLTTFLSPVPEVLVEPVPLVADGQGGVLALGTRSHNLLRLGADGSVTLLASPTLALPASFSEPVSLAMDSQDNVYVACLDSHEVVRVTPSGDVSVVIDVSGDGLGNGLDSPSSVAVDGSDTLWVASRTVDRIFSVTPGGVVTLELDASGLGPGMPLVDPVVQGSRGRVFALGDGEVFELHAASPHVELVGPAGAGGSTLGRPLQVEADPLGRVYVRDSNDVFRVAPSGAVGPIFSKCHDMAVDGTGSAWFLVDTGFGQGFPFLVEREVDGDLFTHPLEPASYHVSLSADEAGNAYFVERQLQGADTVWTVPEGGTPTVLVPAAIAEGLDEGFAPVVAADGAVWILGEESANVLRVSAGVVDEVVDGPTWSFRGSNHAHVDHLGRIVMFAAPDVVVRLDPALGTSEVLAGPDAPGIDTFNLLTDAATDPQGAVWVTSYGNDRVYRIDPGAAPVLVADASGDGVHALDAPNAIAVDLGGAAYVSSLGTDSVFRIAPSGGVSRILGPQGDGKGNILDEPVDVAVGPTGEVYVAGKASDNVFRVDPGGDVTEVIDSQGGGAGALLGGPAGLAVAADGTLYVTSSENGRVLRRTPDGTVTAVVLPMNGKVISPADVAVDAFGSVYATATTSRILLRRDADGTVTDLVAPSTFPLDGFTIPTSLDLSGSGDVVMTTSDFPFLTVIRQDDWFTDLGGSSPGVVGRPVLRAKGVLAPGTPQDRVLERAPPNALMLAWIAFASTPLDAIGGTVHAFPPNVQLFYVADPLGISSLSVTWPAGIPSGIDIYLQFIVQDLSVPDGLTLSNAVMRTTP